MIIAQAVLEEQILGNRGPYPIGQQPANQQSKRYQKSASWVTVDYNQQAKNQQPNSGLNNDCTSSAEGADLGQPRTIPNSLTSKATAGQTMTASRVTADYAQ